MGVIISFIFGYFALVMKGAMNACGVAVNLIATGGTVFVLVMLTGSKANSSALKSLTFPVVNIPVLKDIPVLGTIFSGQNLVTYIAWAIVAVTAWMLYKTKLGINIRAVGENPAAAKARGTERVKAPVRSPCHLRRILRIWRHVPFHGRP